MSTASRLPKPAAADDTARLLDAHRAGLVGHCYRMLGSAAEADDAVQETMVRAWKNLDKFEGRSALRTWLFSIATRVCLDALGDRMRRTRCVEHGPMGSLDSTLTALPASTWIEPIPDQHALPDDAGPAERAMLKQSIRLAFLAALQHLPPRQRAALLLTEVLGWSASEAAETLEMSVAAINSALQRARATLAARDVDAAPAPPSPAQSQLLASYVEAFERYDLDALTRLLHEEAVLSMPPFPMWLQGTDLIQAWMLGPGAPCRGSRLVPVEACGSPAFAQYRPSGPGVPHHAWALIVLELSGERVAAMTYFLDTAAVFPRFGLPLSLA